MWAGFNVITDNLGISLPYLLLLVGALGSFISMAKDFKYGLILNLLLSSAIFMYLYDRNLNYVPALAVLMLTLVIMAFSIYFQNKTSSSGGIA